jgi:putative ABC transport system permease protein
MFFSDLRFTLIMMRRAPLFAVAVILTIALAIGANTSIFSVVNAVLLRPLPYSQPDRIMQVAETNEKLNLPRFAVSIPNFVSWREQTQTFQELGGISVGSFTLTGAGEPEQLTGGSISPALVRILGIPPVLGRGFSDAEEKPGAPAVVMIGEGLWKRRFGGDPALIGRTLELNGAPRTVVGIAPAAYALIVAGDVYTPLTIDLSKEIRLSHTIFVFGRLRDGATPLQAQSEMDAISANVIRQYPEVRDWGIRVVSLFDTFVAPPLESALVALLCAVLAVLLIACANIANLFLTRSAAREREMAVRTAIGASRAQLIRHMLVESVTLSITGGSLGILGTIFALRIINQELPAGILPIPAVTLDRTVLAFGVTLTLLAGLIFGIVPAWRIAWGNLYDVLKQGGRGSESGIRSRMRNVLVAVELALATILLVGAGLLIQSIAHLQRVQLGFDSHNLLTFQVSPPAAQYSGAIKAAPFYSALIDSLASVPGVRGAAVSSGIPFGAGSYNTSQMLTEGPSVLPPNSSVAVNWRAVSPGYFRTMRIPLLRGRDFNYADTASGTPVMIISQSTAQKFWGNDDPIGRTLRHIARPPNYVIIGEVGDVHDTALNQESPTLYYSTTQRVAPLMDVAVRTSGPPRIYLAALREKVHELNPQLALANVRTMDEWLSASAAQPRLNAWLLGAFAAMALLIAAIGIYGVLAYSVARRTREIGVRMALGSSPERVLRLVVGEGMKVALAGLIVGLLGGFALGRALSSLVYGVSVHDPLTFAAVAVVLAIVALVACMIPARRASQVDPLVALRAE